MGILDDASDLLNRETTRMGKAVRSASINSRLKELHKQRTAAMARLGEALYPRVKDDVVLREASEALFDCILDIDRQIKGLEYDMAALDRHDALISSGVACLKCGNPVSENDQFCPSCGSRVENVIVADRGEGHCPRCGARAEPGCSFCMQCGTKIPS